MNAVDSPTHALPLPLVRELASGTYAMKLYNVSAQMHIKSLRVVWPMLLSNLTIRIRSLTAME